TVAGVRAPLAGALLASLATFVQLLVVIGLVDVEVLRRLWLPVLAGLLVLLVVAALVYRGASIVPDQDPAEPDEPQPIPGRPFALRPALILAAVLTGALLVGRWGAEVLGPRGAVLAAFAAGLADAHAGSVAAASLAAKGDITVDTALISVAAALGSNLIVKTVLAFTAGGRRFGIGFLAAMAVPSLVFGAALTAAVVYG
ncbi:MAG: DUF4010 domain-containing protein, partial [Mycobacterium sp.]|nr:DUF4010 domain-containing protein [Mycobacterium sp.]